MIDSTCACGFVRLSQSALQNEWCQRQQSFNNVHTEAVECQPESN